MSYRFNPFFTLLAPDLNNRDHVRVKEIFDCLGRSRKTYIAFVLQVTFPEYFKSGEISPLLDTLIKKYVKKPTTKDYVANPIFINWNKKIELDLLCYDLLSQFKDGAMDFLVYVLSNYSPVSFNWDLNFYYADGKKILAEAEDTISPQEDQPVNNTEPTDEEIPDWFDEELPFPDNPAEKTCPA